MCTVAKKPSCAISGRTVWRWRSLSGTWRCTKCVRRLKSVACPQMMVHRYRRKGSPIPVKWCIAARYTKPAAAMHHSAGVGLAASVSVLRGPGVGLPTIKVYFLPGVRTILRQRTMSEKIIQLSVNQGGLRKCSGNARRTAGA